MRAVRTFLSWVFALGAVIFLRSSVSAVLNVVGWPGAHFPSSVASAVMSAAAPLLGANTDEILGDVLGLSAAEIGALHDAGWVAGLS